MKTDLSIVSQLSGSGVYTLILFVSKETTVKVGSLGKQKFQRGHYSYTGSALGNGAALKHRITRHLRKEKRLFWHIDYLLADPNVSVDAVVAAKTNKKMECHLNSYLNQMNKTEVPVYRFGASDCRKNCKSHLLYFPELKSADMLTQKLFRHLSSSAGILSVCVIP